MKRLYALALKKSAVRRADAYARSRVPESLERKTLNPKYSFRKLAKEYERWHETISRRTAERLRKLRMMESKLEKQIRSVQRKMRAVYRVAGVDPSEITSAIPVKRKRARSKRTVAS